jgi:excinuclease ABC subunit C
MKLCAGYCRPEAREEDYREAVELSADILRGKYRQLTDSVFSEMQKAAENMEFERAARLRDRYKALKGLENRQTVTGAIPELDAVACALGGNMVVLCILHYNQGGLAGKDLVFGENPLGELEPVVFGELLSQYYLNSGRAPKTVCLASKPADMDQLQKALETAADKSVHIYQPMRGEKFLLQNWQKKTRCRSFCESL